MRKRKSRINPFPMRAPEVKRPTRADVFGPPGDPIGICQQCGKMFPKDQMQIYQPSPKEMFWLCPRCKFKKKMRETFNARL